MRKAWGGMVLAVVCVLLLSSCAARERHTSFLCMGTVIDLKIHAVSEAPLEEAKRMLQAYNALFDPEAEGELGRLKRGESVAQSDEASRVLALAGRARAYTRGAFSPAVLHAMRAWGFSPQRIEARTPTEEELEALLREEALFDEISLPEGGEAELCLPTGLSVDFGAIVKGWSGDRLYEMLVQKKVSSALLSLGGNIICVGGKPGGEPWQIGVAHPRSGEVYAVVEARDAHIITSADDQRYYLNADGQRVSHILDPRTMRPARAGLISVTVVTPAGPDAGAWADMLTTAAFVLGREEGIALLEAYEPRILYLAVTEEGEVLVGGDESIARVELR